MNETINLLLNGAIGEPFAAYRHDRELQTAASWAPWWLSRAISQPEPKPLFGPFSLEGNAVQQMALAPGIQTAGLYQQAPVTAAESYRLSVETQIWSRTGAEGQLDDDRPEIRLKIGVDTASGLDPAAPELLWSAAAKPWHAWERLELSFTAQASIVTIFLKGTLPTPELLQSILWRDACLTPAGVYRPNRTIVGPGDTFLTATPERPGLRERVTVVASSNHNHTFVELLVLRPDQKQAAVVFQGPESSQNRYLWRFHFETYEEGLYDLRLTGEQGTRLLARQMLDVGATAATFHTAPPPAGGRARSPYRRVYVLLPPTADANWFQAAARGGFEGRYTIGFSADDAGVGELEDRLILAINPHHWPEPLTAAWFRRHYPGARFTAVVANKPEDLERWLKQWVAS